MPLDARVGKLAGHLFPIGGKMDARDLLQAEAPLVAPLGKPGHVAHIGGAGVRIRNCDGEKLEESPLRLCGRVCEKGGHEMTPRNWVVPFHR